MERFEENRNVPGSAQLHAREQIIGGPHDETRGVDIAGVVAVLVMAWGPFIAAALSST